MILAHWDWRDWHDLALMCAEREGVWLPSAALAADLIAAADKSKDEAEFLEKGREIVAAMVSLWRK